MTKRSKRSKHKDSSDDELQSLNDSFEEEISEVESFNSDDNRKSKKEIKKKSSTKKETKKDSNKVGKRSKAKSKKNISSSEEDSDESGEDMEEDDEENLDDSEEKSSEAGEDEEDDSEDGDEIDNWNSKNKNQNTKLKTQKVKSPKINIKTNEKGKKRYISDVEDGEVATSDVLSSSDNDSIVSSVFNDGYDSELLGNEEDRKRLDEMTEKEREQEIYRRTEQRDLLMRQFEMKKKIKQKEKDALKAEKKKLKAEKKRESKGKKNKSLRVGSASSDNEPQSRTKLCTSYNEEKDNTSEDEDRSLSNKAESIMDRRKANESKRKDTHVSKALAHLKADREKKKQQAEDNRHKQEKIEQQKNSKTRQAISSTSSEEDSDSGKHRKSRNRRRHSDSSSPEDSEDSDASESEDEDQIKKRKPMNSKDDLNRVKLSRFRIEKWVHAPFFKKIACGCFVRIGIGLNAGSSIYRVAEVLDVVETAKVYTLGSTKTNKGFKLRHGEDERTYRLEFVSNQPFTDTEYKRWKEAMDRGNIPLPTLGQIEIKSKEMKAYNNYRFNDEDIDYIINEKKRFSQKSDKVAEKKIELLKEREEADQMGELDRVKEIDGLIADLNEKQQESLMRRNGSFNLLATINQRNREESNKRVEDAMRMDHERQQETGDDPFKRRKGYLDVSEALKKKAVPTHTFDKEKKKNDIAASAASVKKMDAPIFEDLLAPVSKTPIEILPKVVELPQSYDVLQMQQAKKKEEKPKENTHNDLFIAHNFDININLTVPNFNAPAANLAPAISENRFNSAPRRGALNLDEYKRKKGLI